MFKDTVTYKTPFNEERTRDIYFHIQMHTMAEGMGDLDTLLDRWRMMMEIFEEDKRSLTTPETQELFRLIGDLMRAGYGVRDGDRHKQDRPPGSGEIWAEFEETGAYDAYILNLFQNPEKANEFMNNVWPEDIKNSVLEDEKTLPSDEALMAMSDEEFDKVVHDHTVGKTTPFKLIQVGMRRKNSV